MSLRLRGLQMHNAILIMMLLILSLVPIYGQDSYEDKKAAIEERIASIDSALVENRKSQLSIRLSILNDQLSMYEKYTSLRLSAEIAQALINFEKSQEILLSADDPNEIEEAALNYANSKKVLRGLFEGASICAQDSAFLGIIAPPSDSQSIFCSWGEYGATYSSKSIWYTLGSYGGFFSNLSPFWEFASTPPIIMMNDKPIARLSVGMMGNHGELVTIAPETLKSIYEGVYTD